jgi:hypothetical protein
VTVDEPLPRLPQHTAGGQLARSSHGRDRGVRQGDRGSVRSDRKICDARCQEQVASTLPAAPETVAAFLASDASGGAVAIIKRRTTSINPQALSCGAPGR